jgi:hypothetical protein
LFGFRPLLLSRCDQAINVHSNACVMLILIRGKKLSERLCSDTPPRTSLGKKGDLPDDPTTIGHHPCGRVDHVTYIAKAIHIFLGRNGRLSLHQVWSNKRGFSRRVHAQHGKSSASAAHMHEKSSSQCGFPLRLIRIVELACRPSSTTMVKLHSRSISHRGRNLMMTKSTVITAIVFRSQSEPVPLWRKIRHQPHIRRQQAPPISRRSPRLAPTWPMPRTCTARSARSSERSANATAARCNEAKLSGIVSAAHRASAALPRSARAKARGRTTATSVCGLPRRRVVALAIPRPRPTRTSSWRSRPLPVQRAVPAQ